MSVGFIVKPLPVVDVAVSMEEFSLSASLIILPLPFVARLVWPNHSAFPVSQTAFPLALVDSACFVVVSASLNRDVFLIKSA